MSEGGNRSEAYRVAPVPYACETCPLHERALWGCGWDDETRGKAEVLYTRGAPETKTCPQWYARQPAVADVTSHLEDYERGALGNVLELPAAFLDYLRAASSERAAWQAEQQAAQLRQVEG